MSSCIYDDAPSTTICPGCDFGVCQDCIDGGGDGVCKTCYEERSSRQKDSAFQREYTVEAQVPRCNYCRAAEDESTTLDAEGYCDACRALSRCILHEELIAVGHCKTCRREFCRKCLGFTDVCQECTAKNKTRPLKEKAPSATAAPKSSKSPKKAKKTSPMEEPAAASGRGAKGTKGGGTKGLKGKSRQLEDEPQPQKKGPKKPTRGQAAIEEKLTKKASARSRTQLLIAASILAVGMLVMVSGMYLHAMSPEEQARKLRDQMITVHRGVVHHYRKNGKLPKNSDDIQRALADLKIKGANKIKITLKSADPGAVIYVPGQSGFMIQGADSKGELLTSPAGGPFYLDQYYDSTPL